MEPLESVYLFSLSLSWNIKEKTAKCFAYALNTQYFKHFELQSDCFDIWLNLLKYTEFMLNHKEEEEKKNETFKQYHLFFWFLVVIYISQQEHDSIFFLFNTNQISYNSPLKFHFLLLSFLLFFHICIFSSTSFDWPTIAWVFIHVMLWRKVNISLQSQFSPWENEIYSNWLLSNK